MTFALAPQPRGGGKEFTVEIELEQYIDGLFPWDLSVKLGGKSYKTRPLLLGDLLTVESLLRENAPTTDSLAALLTFKKLRDMVLSLFEGEAPALLDQPHVLMVVLKGVVTYWNGYVKKNTEALRVTEQPAATAATTTTAAAT